MFYVIHVESILVKLPVVLIGDTGTIPFAVRQNARDFVDAAFDTKERSGDGSTAAADGGTSTTRGPCAGPANASISEKAISASLPVYILQFIYNT